MASPFEMELTVKSHYLKKIEIFIRDIESKSITIGEFANLTNKYNDTAEKALNTLVSDGYLLNPVEGYYTFPEKVKNELDDLNTCRNNPHYTEPSI